MQLLRLGMAGLGTASRQILPQIRNVPGMELTAAADVRKEALEEFKARYHAKVFSSVKEMCESDEIGSVTSGSMRSVKGGSLLCLFGSKSLWP